MATRMLIALTLLWVILKTLGFYLIVGF